MHELALTRARVSTLALALILVVSPLNAAPSVSADTPGDGPVEAVLRVQTPSYTLDAAGLRVEGYAAHDAPGAPALPVWGTVVELPPSGEWTLSVDPGPVEEIALSEPLRAVPVPLRDEAGPPAPDEEERRSAVPLADRPDPAIYAADAFYPAELVQPGVEQWQAGRRLLALRVFPFRYNPAAGVLRYYPDIRVTVRMAQGELGARAARPSTAPALRAASAQDARASQDGSLRIRTDGRGMVALTYDALVAADAAVASADPATFAVTYLGDTVAIRMIDEDPPGWGAGDRVVFYAEPYAGRYQKDNVCWFTWGGFPSPLMQARTVTPTGTEPEVTTIQRTLHVEVDKTYISTIHRLRTEDHWFDSIMGPSYDARSYELALVDPVLAGDLALRALLNSGPAQSTNDRSASLSLNAHAAGTFAWSGLVDYLAETTVNASWLDAAPNKLTLSPVTGNVYPDWVEVTYMAEAKAYGDSLYIESVAPGANEVVVSGFTAAEVVIYDLRDPARPVVLDAPPGVLDEVSGTYAQHFWDEDLPSPTYFLSTDAALVAPLAIEAPELDGTPALLRSAANAADYIAIVHRTLWDAVDPLLAHRAGLDGFTVAKVDVQQIYDEFSYGRRDPEAIRAFLTYAYRSWKGPEGDARAPQFVLLVGSGTYDFTGVKTDATKPNLVPPYLVDVDPWSGETASDNRFVSIDDPVGEVEDFMPEMAVGRIPAQTPANLTAAVEKILAYETSSPAGDWQHRAVYVADTCVNTAGDFHWFSDQGRNALPAQYDDTTIYYYDGASCVEGDYDTVPGMQAAVRAEFDAGALMLQWFGHASSKLWGSRGYYPPGEYIFMFSSNVVPKLAANTAWPFTFAYTCWSGYFIEMAKQYYVDYMDLAVGEALVLTPERGSVADLSPSGQHVGGSLVTLNRGMTEAIFVDRIDRMGLAVNAGKEYYYATTSSFLDVIDTSILFGDPATRLRLPPLAAIARHDAVPTTATLSWQHVPQYASYEIRRSPRPYFAWTDDDADPRGTVPAPPAGTDAVTFDDGNAIGDPAVNYYYLVRGVNAAGTAGESNRVGEFDFSLAPGE